MHIHILGICGTFMGGIALLARELDIKVSGSDRNVYPPMSTQLEEAGIALHDLDDLKQFEPEPDLVVIGNAMSRGNPTVEHVLNNGMAYTSGPEFLASHILKNRWVLGVAGTHGKTTTSSMLAWILEYAGLKPGFLIGGIPENFGVSARCGSEPFFVVEADEYDTAFFDKRSKFVHYHPRTLILNNLEFDHADIFKDLTAIQTQFHHLVRTIPSNGLITLPANDDNLKQVIDMGCWTPTQSVSDMQDDAENTTESSDWKIILQKADASEYEVIIDNKSHGTVKWPLIGQHNAMNGVMAIAAARHAGVSAEVGIEALGKFQNVKRRLEIIGQHKGITLYDDFAHHPTAITTTLDGLRKSVGQQRIIAVLEPRSNTMRMGIHKDVLAKSLDLADEVILYEAPDLGWDINEVASNIKGTTHIFSDVDSIIQHLIDSSQSDDHILIMSNGAFGGLHKKLNQAFTDLAK